MRIPRNRLAQEIDGVRKEKEREGYDEVKEKTKNNFLQWKVHFIIVFTNLGSPVLGLYLWRAICKRSKRVNK